MIRGLIFDLNGTAIDIWTDEEDLQVYRTTANFLEYYGIRILPEQLKERYKELNRRQRKNSPEKYPEFNVVKLFRELIEKAPGKSVKAPIYLPEAAAVVFRAVSRRRLAPYPGVYEILNFLKKNYVLAAVSDGQSRWALPELRSVGLDHFFSVILISGDFGFRKPDPRLFEGALKQMNLPADEVIFIGNDMYRDVYGADRAGLKTVFFKSNQGDQRSRGIEPDYIIYSFEELPQAVAFLSCRA